MFTSILTALHRASLMPLLHQKYKLFLPMVTNFLPKYALHIQNQVTYKNTHENTCCTLTNGPFYITTKPVLHILLTNAAVYTALP